MELVPLTKSIPETEPKIRVYRRYVTLNVAAVNLLGLKDDDYVQFATPIHGFRKEIYLRKTSVSVGAYRAKTQRGRGVMRLSSNNLCSLLADNLDGPGCYLVSPSVTVDDPNGMYYNIFFKNYDKKNTD